jgi:hypothetical protein
MRSFIFIAGIFFFVVSALATTLIPTKPGTVWQYDVTNEAGESSPGQTQLRLCVSGTQQFGGKELLKLETFVGDVVTKTELIALNENGIVSFAHTGHEGKMIGFVSPQIVVPANLKPGTNWDCIDEIADVRVHQHFTVADTEEVSVPAGNFRALRLHCEESAPLSVTIDRWFVIGVGFVKEIETLRSPAGDLLDRRTLELARLAGAETKKEETLKKLTVGVSSRPAGDFETEFSSSAQNLYARWQGRDLRAGAKVRAIWIAENVGAIAPPNYKIDDAVAIAGARDAHGTFTLSRPEDGWAPGNYRVEFYLDETLVETVKLQIK